MYKLQLPFGHKLLAFCHNGPREHVLVKNLTETAPHPYAVYELSPGEEPRVCVRGDYAKTEDDALMELVVRIGKVNPGDYLYIRFEDKLDTPLDELYMRPGVNPALDRLKDRILEANMEARVLTQWQRETKVDELRPVRVEAGRARQWVRCNQCSRTAYYDYTPYSLESAIMTLPCNHDMGRRFSDCVTLISEEEAHGPTQWEREGVVDDKATVLFSEGVRDGYIGLSRAD